MVSRAANPRCTAPTAALILSGSIGKGHDSVAEACRAALGGVGIEAKVLDCMSLMGGVGSRAGTAVFRRLLSMPAVYDGFHFDLLRNGRWLAPALEWIATARLLPALRREVEALGERPLVLSVFPTGVSAAARLAQGTEGRCGDLTLVTVLTDACAHRLWVAEGTDLYVVCSPLAALTVQRYDPTAAVAVVPPAVRPQFYGAPSKAAARDALGVARSARCVLLMAGGWGLGPLAETSEALAGAGYRVLAVAGSNQRLLSRLATVARRGTGVSAFGTTDEVPALMSASDVVITSSGQTCHEARVVGRPLVLLDVVPGHGRENTLHELELGGALACAPEPAAVVSAVDAVLREQPEQTPWPVRSAAEWDKHFFGALAGAGIAPPTHRRS